MRHLAFLGTIFYLLHLEATESSGLYNNDDRLMEHATKKASQVNKSVRSFFADPRDCYSCQHSLDHSSVANNGRCDEKSRYLENDLQKIITGNNGRDSFLRAILKDDRIKGHISKNCVSNIMVRFPDNRSFVKCDPNGNFVKKEGRPCASESYVNLATRSFNIVGQCLAPLYNFSNEDLQMVVDIIGVESGFHINPKSPTGVVGVGQLTGDTIDYLKQAEISKLINHLEKSKSSYCKEMAKSLLKMEGHGICSRTSLKNDHPLKGFLYAMTLYAKNKREIKRRLHVEVPDRSLQILAAWSYNTGWGKIAASAKTLSATDSEALVIAKIQKRLMNGKTACHNARCKEIQSYFTKLRSRAKERICYR